MARCGAFSRPCAAAAGGGLVGVHVRPVHAAGGLAARCGRSAAGGGGLGFPTDRGKSARRHAESGGGGFRYAGRVVGGFGVLVGREHGAARGASRHARGASLPHSGRLDGSARRRANGAATRGTEIPPLPRSRDRHRTRGQRTPAAGFLGGLVTSCGGAARP